MTHVLVTGGAGFIGSHLVDAYLDRGWRVSIIDDLSTGDRRNLNPKAEFHEADLLEAGPLIEKLRPDVISHHAAQVDVRKSVEDPARDAELNIVASLALLQKAAETGVKRVIFASSGGAIYGEPLFTPQTEAHPLQPMSPYGCAKLAVEQYMRYYREVLGLPTVALRYANVYGPRQGAKGEAGVVAVFARLLMSGGEVTINGTGEQTRDYVHVADVVRANMAVTDDATLVGPFNVGTGVETSVNDLYREMAALMSRASSMRFGPGKIGEQVRSVLDGTRFSPYRSLPEGLRETTTWFEAQT